MPTPTVRRLQLGNELRHLRERADRELTDAAEVIERSWSVVSKLENGITGIRQKPLRELVQYYKDAIGTGDDGSPADGGDPIDPEEFCELNKGSEQRGRWRGYRAIYPKWFRMAVDLEADSEVINLYQSEIIHGLFQTEEYIRALFTHGMVRSINESTESAVKARLERQRILANDTAPRVTAVLSESGLRRQVGGPEVMREQLHHLAELSQRPNISLHVAPFSCRTAAGLPYPFVQFRVPSMGPKSPPLEFVFVEQFHDADYLDGPNEVAEYSDLWNGLLGAALDPVESREFLLRAAEQH